MRAATFLALVRRESRGARGRLVFFTACLAVGVAAVVAVAGLSTALRDGLTARAAELLGGDLVVQSRRALPEGIDARLERPEVEAVVPMVELSSLVAAPADGGAPADGAVPPGAADDGDGAAPRVVLAQLKAVGPGYPLRGALVTEPAAPLAGLLGDDGVVVAPELLARLGLSVGDRLLLGGVPFAIRASVVSEPDRLEFSLTLGPRVFLSLAGLARTPLTGFGALAETSRLVRLVDPSRTEELARALRAELPDRESVRIRTANRNQPTLREGYQRVESFLALVALVSLLVGGIGVAQTVRAWVASRVAGIAVLRCLGLRPREVLALYVGQTLLLALAGSVVGAALGTAVQLGLPRLLADIVPLDLLAPWQPWAALRGIGLGLAVALLFAAPPLLAVRRVPPSLVLRREGEVLVGSGLARGVTLGLLAAGTLAVAWVQSGVFLHALSFTGLMVAAVLVLALTGGALARLAAAVPRGRLPLGMRWGVAALARPEAGTVAGVLALGLGVLVVLAMALVQRGLADELQTALPKDAPNAFLIDIQPDQWEAVASLLDAHGAVNVDSVPVVTARLVAIDGGEVGDSARGRGGGERRGEGDGDGAGREGRRGWAHSREQRLTWREELPPGNGITGREFRPAPGVTSLTVGDRELWTQPGTDEISLEDGYAEDLGVGLGAVLGFEAAGRAVDLRVTSLRSVDWRSFRINFFLLAEPGSLDGLPSLRIAAAHLPPGSLAPLMGALAAQVPNVSLLDVREILGKVSLALDRIGTGVRALGLFTVLAGIVILAGSVGATSLRRGREAALLKTLGMTRRGVLVLHGTEQVLVGLVAGTLGAFGGVLLAWIVFRHVLELAWTPPPGVVAGAVAAAVVLSTGAGLAAGARALASRPLSLLREG